LTTTGTADRSAISPDGKFVAYVQRDRDSSGLWIRQVNTPSNIQIVSPEAGFPIRAVTVAPDDRYIDFVRGGTVRQGTLWRVSFLGGTPKRLVEQVASPVGWSPDGRHMAFVRTPEPGGNTTRLVLTDEEGSHERVLAARVMPATFAAFWAGDAGNGPAWSPDGRQVAVVGDDERGSNITIVDIATETERVIATPPTSAAGIAWVDEHRLILSRSDQQQSPAQLWRMTLPAGKLTRVTNDLSDYEGVSISLDRDSLVTTRSERRASVWAGDASGESGAEIVPPFIDHGATGLPLTWASDRLLYTASADARRPSSIMVVTPAQPAPEELVPGAYSPAATPDGKTIVMESAKESGLWKTDAEGRQSSSLVSGNASRPIVTPDGRNVVFISSRSGLQSPWIVSIDGGAPRQLMNRFAAMADVSTDGRMLALGSIRDDRSEMLVVCKLQDCSAVREFPVHATRVPVHWLHDGSGVAFVPRADPANIWVQPLDGVSPHALTHFMSGHAITNFAWSRDGKRLAIARSTTTNDIVLFKGLR
jgi:Tol biopolymer transport system component